MMMMLTDGVNKFRGPYRFLSNFWPSPVILNGITYPTVEHAYQAAKTKSKRLRKEIAACDTPGQAKRAGRKIKLRPDWSDELRLSIMEDLLKKKFSDPILKSMLQDTAGRTLTEGNDWGDKFWGTVNGVGENNLGKLLMSIRDCININDQECLTGETYGDSRGIDQRGAS